MGIREELARNKWVPISAIALAAIVAGSMIFVAARPEKKPNSSLGYYSDDDGKTWFEDSSMLFAPFEHDGKTAVAAHIFTYDNGSKQFCGYLSKYTDSAKRKLEAASAAAKAKGDASGFPDLLADPAFMQTSGLVKAPGAGHPWIAVTDARSAAVCSARAPDGSTVDEAVIY